VLHAFFGTADSIATPTRKACNQPKKKPKDLFIYLFFINDSIISIMPWFDFF